MEKLRFAVIGHPIAHTMSPMIHRQLFALSGLSPTYDALDVPDLAKDWERLRAYDGLNVTIPHKAAIFPFLDRLDGRARLFGSVNTVKNEDGMTAGYTTDGAGFRLALESASLTLAGRILLLGRGGAARAIAFECALRGRKLELDVVCRSASLQGGRALVHELKKLSPDGKFRALDYETLGAENRRYDLAVNCTSVGMYPNAGESIVGEDVIARTDAVFDAVYNPVETEFLKIAKRLGKTAVGGMEMLVGQAAAAHQIWYGGEFRREDVARIVAAAEQETVQRFGV